MEIGEENLAQRAEQADFSKLVSALWECQAGQSRLEGEVEGSARGSADMAAASLLVLCTGSDSCLSKGQTKFSYEQPLFCVFEVQKKFK